MEKRFQVHEPNISAWRRAVCGDLTSAFNFVDPNGEALPSLPATSRHAADGLRQRQEQLPQVPLPSPAHQRLPHQRRLARPSRALPYQLHVEASVAVEQRRVTLNLFNTGEQGAVFHVYDRRDLAQIPRVLPSRRARRSATTGKRRMSTICGCLAPTAFIVSCAAPEPAAAGGAFAPDGAQPAAAVE
ncbi:hypothetical protein AK51_23735 [Serratia nematodiphila DZ0503SBS1]|nr:hypothetical protein AK51_23735 [Serratia nematodiphila DZ0503SBS1]